MDDRSFFIADNSLTGHSAVRAEDLRTTLSAGGIVWFDLTFEDRRGVIVPVSDKDKVLGIIGCEVVDTYRMPWDGVVGLVFSEDQARTLITTPPVGVPIAEEAVPKYKVKFDSWSGEGKTKFQKIVSDILVPIVDSDVHISVPHCNTEPPTGSASRFMIHIWSAHEYSTIDRVTVPEKIWGERVPVRDGAYQVNEEPWIVRIMDGDYNVGSLVGPYDLYIHSDMVHHGNEDELSVFRLLMVKVVEVLSYKDTMDRLRVAWADYAANADCNSYMRMCKGYTIRLISRYKEQTRDRMNRVAELQGRIVEESRAYHEADQVLKALQERSEGSYLREYENLINMKGVRAIHVPGNNIQVDTDMIYCTDPRSGNVHEIGEFTITLSPSGPSAEFRNKTRVVDGYEKSMHAPHVFSSGIPCLGSISSTLPDLIGRMEIGAAITVAMEFLQSVNVEDGAGKHIDNWPIAKEAT
jgi:hypothetical protein